MKGIWLGVLMKVQSNDARMQVPRKNWTSRKLIKTRASPRRERTWVETFWTRSLIFLALENFELKKKVISRYEDNMDMATWSCRLTKVK